MNSKELAARRVMLNLTQKQLGNLVGLSNETISNYETGKIKIPKNKVLILQQALGIKEEPISIKESVNDRIKFLLYHYGTDIRKFSRKIGIKNFNTVHNVIHDHTNPSYTTLQRILRGCPEINPGWLLDGYGRMLKADIDTSVSFDDFMNAKIADQLKRLQDQIDMINEKIKE